MNPTSRGFTLVELSIVLVILGLLVGGVLSGQSLIRAAELRSVGTQKDQFQTAIYAFKDKFFALPGDMPNAFMFWGGQIAGCAEDKNIDQSPADFPCNGDGNGFIHGDGRGTAVGSDVSDEGMLAWGHLSVAGLIEGGYSGTSPGTNPTQGMPRAKLDQAYWLWESDGGMTKLVGADGTAEPERGLFLMLQEANSMTPEAAWNLDKKLDDGRANTGYQRGSTAGCLDLDTDGDAANGREDVYGIQANGATSAACDTLGFILG